MKIKFVDTREYWYPSESASDAILLIAEVEYRDDSFDHAFGIKDVRGLVIKDTNEMSILFYIDTFEYDMGKEFKSAHPAKYNDLLDWFQERLNEEYEEEMAV